MRTYYDCYPCFLRQAISAGRRVGADGPQQSAVIRRVLTLLQDIQPGATPPEIAYRVHRIVRDTISAPDPYEEAKAKSTEDALAIYLRLKRLVVQSDDALNTAIRVSIAGNIIDYGVRDDVPDLWKAVEAVLHQPFAIDDTAKLRSKLESADHVLFLGDNAGETVFDRILIETLSMPVTYAVKEGPILNDATMVDAIDAGLDQCATLLSNGTDAPGTIFSYCSDEFLQEYETAPVVIAKGQANYECLSTSDPKVFCLLRVKCPVIAHDIGTPVDSIVVRQSRQSC